MSAVCNVTNAAQSTRLLASTTLRNTLGTKTLQVLRHIIKTKMRFLLLCRTSLLTERTLPRQFLIILIQLQTIGASG